MYTRLKRVLFGEPLPTHQEHHERLNIPLALAVFASDALSSTAYATEEILIALAASAYIAQANFLSLPVAAAIAILMAIVVISYRQVIRAYPQSGGAYIVSKENLGKMPCLIAGSALLLDYILTVSVSTSAGVAAIVSTGWVPVSGRVPLALFFILFITLLNLRGVRESGKVIAVPVYAFIGTMLTLIAVGLWRAFSGLPPVETTAGMTPVPTETAMDIVINLSLILVLLKAFSHGCAALTGIEAISIGVKAFKEPTAVNANRTMVIMACLLGSIFLGLTYLAFAFQIHPMHNETVISQIARAVFGSSPLYFAVQIFTTIFLVLAANTAFSGFPRLATILASDGFLPRQLMNLGDRLVFSNGIIVLGLASGSLIWLYHADTHSLIPLYAVGVFLSFTLAQTGMVVYHKRHPGESSTLGMLINGAGAFTTGSVTLLLAFEKFFEGAWIILVAIPTLVIIFLKIYHHYQSVGRQLALPPTGGHCPVPIEHTVLVLVSSLNRGTIPALEYASTISNRVEAVHVELNAAATENLRKQWADWGCGVPLVVLQSPYRSITEPLIDYIDQVESRYEHDIVTIIVPEFVTKKFWHNILHNQTAILIKTLLRFRRGKVVTSVRYYLEE